MGTEKFKGEIEFEHLFSKATERLQKKYPEFFDKEGQLIDPRSAEDKIRQCIWSLEQSNKKTIVQHDPLRVCLRNILGINIPPTEREVESKIMSFKAQKKYLTKEPANGKVQKPGEIAIFVSKEDAERIAKNL